MIEYFENGTKHVGRTPTSLPTILNQDLKQYRKHTENSPPMSQDEIPAQLQTKHDLQKLQTIAQNRDAWRTLIRDIQLSENEEDNDTSENGTGQASP